MISRRFIFFHVAPLQDGMVTLYHKHIRKAILLKVNKILKYGYNEITKPLLFKFLCRFDPLFQKECPV